MLDFFFLYEEQVFGDNKLDILKQYGVRCASTDYTILLGGIVDDFSYTSDGEKLINRTSSYWTKSSGYRCWIVDEAGEELIEDLYDRVTGVRLAVAYSFIRDLPGDVRYINGIKVKEYGEYPQTVASKELSFLLEKFYNEGKLKETGKLYTSDSAHYDDEDSLFMAKQRIEYEYNGDKYVRFVADNNGAFEKLSNGIEIKNGDIYWIKVEPIKWLIDEKSDIALSKNVLFSGIQFNRKANDIIVFEESDIKKFIDEYFAKEIVPSNIKDDKLSYNPYKFDFNEVSEEEIIKGCVESNIAVMLHGRSGDGKSARVKELDPDAEILYLINASPDSLGGKSVLINEKMKDIPPTWYTKLVDKCEKEPDKIHIVFFDEITNAPPSIQGMAFNIILDKEINGKWKLPGNARIVAAGNEYSESRSANEMSEPLFNRFAHVYIETKVEDFLKWASTPIETYERLDYKEINLPMKIHPSIYAFIAYKSFKGEDALRTEYTGIKPNADPRKWELSSSILYKTNKPENLRAFIGEDLTKEFISFTKKEVITLEDVISYNYDELIMDVQEKFQTAVSLSKVDETYIDVVREFIESYCSDALDVFDTLWTYGNEERQEKINNYKVNRMV